ncbi:glycosyl transferase family 2 [Gluconacetobacter diazotrophicus PA1 5]|uniref:Glycosyltransferase family 2 protein n=2 Tax=Gluconacetobacter diazotrophicus TaxID=33996 RepID=A0A7W4FCR4_GLUDI|nr:glycosyl transferase family 2 [Gluconacetobacter diazotrophicus PA1 5]MBB2155319.1 glycosyltransferase family 2 protein [Gluconacetobacter diazotrophicus]CAP55119.1 putative glycosyl transferase [Gluconacetobacter diazotrophicus PA1 5]
MSSSPDRSEPVLSIVAAVLNEAENIRPVCAELAESLRSLPPCEVVFVDDGSTDGTVDALLAARAEGVLPGLRVLCHDRRLGKSAALRTGIEAAHGRWIATIDGDGQDDPSEIADMLDLARNAPGRAPLVVGVRLRRRDTLSRRFATRFANGLRGRLLRDGCPDTGAPLKVFLRADFLRLPQFEGLHRFLPALLGRQGVPLLCRPVRHRNRLHGHSKYTNLNRALVGIRDLLGVMWLNNRTRLPHHITER